MPSLTVLWLTVPLLTVLWLSQLPFNSDSPNRQRAFLAQDMTLPEAGSQERRTCAQVLIHAVTSSHMSMHPIRIVWTHAVSPHGTRGV